MRAHFFIVAGLVVGSGSSLAQTPAAQDKPTVRRVSQLANAADLREKLGLSNEYRDFAKLKSVKIAVLDFGFEGFDAARAQLPANATIVENYDPEWVKKNNLGDPEYKKSFEPGNAHGRMMAQAIWAVCGSQADGPQFYLLNANGPTLFRRAVKYAIAQGVHIILFSGHFEGGGNFDGKGTINDAVSEATKAGIIWVNAAGNHHGRVYSGPVNVGQDGYVRFGKLKLTDALKFHNQLDENSFTITLVWNDYKTVEDAGTEKDLDLFLEDENGKAIVKSALKQIGGTKRTEMGESKNPRERLIVPDLGKGTYRIRIKANTGNFTKDDRLRVLLTPSRGDPYPHPDTNKMTNPVQFLDASNEEELFPPADHIRVLTVGDKSEESARGPTADRRVKPDLLLPALPAKWTNGEIVSGTSYSTAFFAGVVATLKAHRDDLTTDDIQRWIRDLKEKAPKTETIRTVQNGRNVVMKVPITRKPEPANWRTPTITELGSVIRK